LRHDVRIVPEHPASWAKAGEWGRRGAVWDRRRGGYTVATNWFLTSSLWAIFW